MVLSLEDVYSGSLQKVSARRYFNSDKEYTRGTVVTIPNNSRTCKIENIYISEETRTVFIALLEEE